MFATKNLLKVFNSSGKVNLSFTVCRELRKFIQHAEVLDTGDSKTIAKSVTPNFDTLPASRIETASPLLPITDQHDILADIAPNIRPSFNLAAYVDKSESLQQLVKLGVDLSSVEKRKGLAEFVLKLDFERDIKGHLMFLNDIGVAADAFGKFITKNPLIFKEDINDLQTRVNYLQVKKFKNDEISRILTVNPFWLMFSTHRIDRRLGYFQKNFNLSGNEIRFLTTKQPRLITYQMNHIRKSTFCVKEEMGFSEDEMKCLLLSKPKLWMINSDELIERFNFAHNLMKISHHQIVQSPEILISRLFRLQQRHKFLEFLGKAQYDPAKDLYVSIKSLVEGRDDEFVINVAKSSMQTYDEFLRTI